MVRAAAAPAHIQRCEDAGRRSLDVCCHSRWWFRAINQIKTLFIQFNSLDYLFCLGIDIIFYHRKVLSFYYYKDLKVFKTPASLLYCMI